MGERSTPDGFWDRQKTTPASGPTLEEQERLRACNPTGGEAIPSDQWVQDGKVWDDAHVPPSSKERNLPALLRDAERRVNAHVFKRGGDDSLASIPANVDRDVDLLLMEAAAEIERLQTELAATRDAYLSACARLLKESPAETAAPLNDAAVLELHCLLQEAVTLAELGDIDEETEAHGWGAWLKQARSVLRAAAPACDECKGAGEIVFNDHGGDPEWDRSEPCRECDGTGRARFAVKSSAPQSDKCEHGIPRRFCTAVHDDPHDYPTEFA